MGHHIDNECRFQSDKYPGMPPNRVRVSLERPESLRGLLAIAADYAEKDPEFAEDLVTALRKFHGDEAVDKATHPVLLIYSGGDIADESRQKIEEFLKSKSAHRVDVLDAADAPPGIGRMRCDDCRRYLPTDVIKTCEECTSQLCEECCPPSRIPHPHSDMGTA